MMKYFLDRMNRYAIPYSQKHNIPCWKLYLGYGWNYILYRCSIRDYFTLDFPLLSKIGKKQFITATECSDYYKKVNDRKQAAILDNKEELLTLFHDYIGRDWCGQKYRNSRQEYEDFILKHNQCILKPLEGSGGHGVEIISPNKVPGGGI